MWCSSNNMVIVSLIWYINYHFFFFNDTATTEIYTLSLHDVFRSDDLIATGGTSEAGAKLVEKSGGIVTGFLFVINLFDLGGKNLLENKGYKTFSLIEFPGH